MSLYDDQIRQRKYEDDEAFSQAFTSMADAVMGSNLVRALKARENLVTDAMGEILSFYNIKAKEVPEEITDINEQIEYILRPNGIMRRTVYLDRGWYKDAVGAMLGTIRETGTLVAFIPGKFSGYSYFDFESGKRVKLNSKNEGIFDREAMAFYLPYPLRKLTIKDVILFSLSTLSIGDLVYYLLVTGLATLIGMLAPWLNSILFDEVIVSGSTRLLFAVAFFMVCVNISSTLLSTVDSLISSKFNTKMTASVEAATMMRIMSMPASFFKPYGSGELTSYADSMNSLSSILVQSVMNTGITSLFSLGYIYSITRFAPGLVFPAMLTIFVTIGFSVVTTVTQLDISRRMMKQEAAHSSLVYALICGIQKIKLSGAEKRAFAKWGKVYSEMAELEYNPPVVIKANQVISTAISLVGTIVMYYFAIVTKVSVADYFAFNAAYGMVMGAFSSLLSVALVVARIKPILEMAKPILEGEPEISEGKEVISSVSGAIELDNVTFRYSENTPVILDNISLRIRRGQYVAIVGKTGCGKSTLMRILLGFETPQVGTVYYDRKDIRKIDLKSLRRKIGVVMQNGKLFMGDIFANIAISAPWITLDEAWEAAEVAGIAEDIRNMPMGMNTIITEGDGGVSGGQRQRLMIARAVAPKPKILMLDEATSALDNVTQKNVTQALDGLKCTRIVIAHRLSTIKQADRIIVLDKGHIIEDGTYEKLMEKKGFFAELVERQMVNAI